MILKKILKNHLTLKSKLFNMILEQTENIILIYNIKYCMLSENDISPKDNILNGSKIMLKEKLSFPMVNILYYYLK